MYLPLNYQKINEFAGQYNPSELIKGNNKTFLYWERSLFQKLCSVITINGLPDEWKGNVQSVLFYCLFKIGYVGVSDIAEVGFCFNPVTVRGFNFYYQPTNATFTNPVLKKSLDLEIGKDCELLMLTNDYYGIWDIVRYHANRLSEIDKAIDMQITTAIYPYIAFAKNKAAAAALKKIMDMAQRGTPLIITDKAIVGGGVGSDEIPFDMLDFNVKDRYVLDQLMRERDSILNSFNIEIGIPTLPYQKAERMVSSEAESKTTESLSRCTTWINTLNSCFDIINKHYNKNMSAELTFQKGDADGKDNAMGNAQPLQSDTEQSMG